MKRAFRAMLAQEPRSAISAVFLFGGLGKAASFAGLCHVELLMAQKAQMTRPCSESGRILSKFSKAIPRDTY
jgi:hypothetical protein